MAFDVQINPYQWVDDHPPIHRTTTIDIYGLTLFCNLTQLLKMTIEIVGFSIKHGDFPQLQLVITRGYLHSQVRFPKPSAAQGPPGPQTGTSQGLRINCQDLRTHPSMWPWRPSFDASGVSKYMVTCVCMHYIMCHVFQVIHMYMIHVHMDMID